MTKTSLCQASSRTFITLIRKYWISCVGRLKCWGMMISVSCDKYSWSNATILKSGCSSGMITDLIFSLTTSGSFVICYCNMCNVNKMLHFALPSPAGADLPTQDGPLVILLGGAAVSAGPVCIRVDLAERPAPGTRRGAPCRGYGGDGTPGLVF